MYGTTPSAYLHGLCFFHWMTPIGIRFHTHFETMHQTGSLINQVAYLIVIVTFSSLIDCVDELSVKNVVRPHQSKRKRGLTPLYLLQLLRSHSFRFFLLFSLLCSGSSPLNAKSASLSMSFFLVFSLLLT